MELRTVFKYIGIGLLFILLGISYIGGRMNNVKAANERYKEQRELTLVKRNAIVIEEHYGYKIIEMDSCEWVFYTQSGSLGGIAHRTSCKYCKERNLKKHGH